MSIMGFLAIVNAYTMRVSLSVAIVQMVGSSNSSEIDPNACPIPPNEGGEIVEVYFMKIFLPQNIKNI
jgi:MFS transporter, ACS family, solute carrier family 17 (sodium-dependent inorganic phosphate cotransporter), other